MMTLRMSPAVGKELRVHLARSLHADWIPDRPADRLHWCLELIETCPRLSKREEHLLIANAAKLLAPRELKRQDELYEGIVEGSLWIEVTSYIADSGGAALRYELLRELRTRYPGVAGAILVILVVAIDSLAVVAMGESMLVESTEQAAVRKLAEERAGVCITMGSDEATIGVWVSPPRDASWTRPPAGADVWRLRDE